MYCALCKYNYGIYKLFMKIFMRKGCRYKCPYKKMCKCEYCGKLIDPDDIKTWHILINDRWEIYCAKDKKIGFKMQEKCGS